MLVEFFDNIVQERVDKTISTLIVKGKEYRRNNNAMHNFDRAGQIAGIPREQAMWGFALKHYISFTDILNDLSEDKLPTIEMVDEKIGDLINYLILCEASLKEKIMLNSKL